MRIAIVNDVALCREALRRVVLSVPGYSVAWQAEDGAEAVRRAAEDRPDVVLMDLVMPVLDGAEATRQIMARSPCPILLVTSSVSGNLQLVYRGLSNGGLDAVNTPVLTPSGEIRDSQGLLSRLDRIARSRQFACSGPNRVVAHEPRPPAVPPADVPAMLALGASTGGPAALASILAGLPAGFPGTVVIIEHISAEFAPNLALWLQGHTRLSVEVARAGGSPRPGTVHVAASDDHLVLDAARRFAYTPDPVDNPYRPSADVFFRSLQENWPRPGVAVLLTGMGTDGARGLLALRRAGWLTIAQDRASSVVYGMPGAAADLGAACRIVSLAQIPAAVLARFSCEPPCGCNSSPRPQQSSGLPFSS